jgi:hypothetical protein
MPFVTNFVDHISPRELELGQKNIELSLRIVKLEDDIKQLYRILDSTQDKAISLGNDALASNKRLRQVLQEQLIKDLERLTKETADKHGVTIVEGIGASV